MREFSTNICDEFDRYQPRENHPDWATLSAEAAALADALRPTLHKPRRSLSERRRRIRSYATAGRNFVANRRLARRGREDLRPLYFIWTMLRSCNFACDYCDDHRGSKYPDLSNKGVLDTEQGKQLLRVMRTRTPSVYFAGGEPTMRKDLPELTRAARDLDYYPIIINTNGSTLDRQLKKESWRGWLADMDVIIVSLDALELPVLETMWRYKRPNDVLRNLLLLRELADEMNFKLMVNAVIQPGAVHHARDVLDFANDLGIYFCPVPMNVGPALDGTLRSDPEYAAFGKLILDRIDEGHRISGSRRMNERLLGGHRIDCRNTLKPHVDYDGNLYWPCKASVKVDPARINVLDYDDVDSLYADAAAAIDPTNFQDRCGAQCNWAQNYSTDAYAHGLKHPLSLVGDVRGFLSAR